AEWRTPPLWGIGLAKVVNPDVTFLHDGRARTLEEAVLWHGGEAASSRDAVLQFDATQRAALIAFLESL
ncbi:MAG: di-heme oxidoredictase family protein, partial [Pseudomonadota bacterium]